MPQYEYLDRVFTLQQAVYQAVGAGSMCWATLGGAGEFDSTRAAKVGDELLLRIEEFTEGRLPKERAQPLNVPAEVLQAFEEMKTAVMCGADVLLDSASEFVIVFGQWLERLKGD